MPDETMETLPEETREPLSEEQEEEETSQDLLETSESTEDLQETSSSASEPSAPDPVSVPSVLEVDNLTIHVAEGITITGLEPETEEEGVDDVGDSVLYAASGNPLNLVIPESRTVFLLGEKQLVFPSSYDDDLFLVDGYLLNSSGSVTIAVDLRNTATVSNYVISQVTFPTYGSSDYITYVQTYGAPYRIVDRYRDGSSLRSYTRTSSAAMTAQDITQPSWYGFYGSRMYGFLFALVVIILLLWGRFRWKV